MKSVRIGTELKSCITGAAVEVKNDGHHQLQQIFGVYEDCFGMCTIQALWSDKGYTTACCIFLGNRLSRVLISVGIQECAVVV